MAEEGSGEPASLVQRVQQAARVYTNRFVKRVASASSEAAASASAAASAVASTASARTQETFNTTSDSLTTLASHYSRIEASALSFAGTAVSTAADHPALVTSAGVPLLMLSLPPLRRSLLVRLRGAEGTVRGADRELKYLKQSIDEHSKEGEKLTERAQLAEQEMQKGREKLIAAGRELKQLSARSKSKESKLSSLSSRLRAVRSPDSLALQREATSFASDVAKQRQLMDRRIRSISRSVPLPPV